MLTGKQLAIVVATTVAGLTAAYMLQIPLVCGFILGFFPLIRLCLNAGVTWKTLFSNMKAGFSHTKEVIWILAMVGIAIPAWTASGTIPYMIDTGLSIIHPGYFVTFSFVLSAVISMLLGTSTGTLSSVGIPLIGIGMLLNIPLPVITGALVSGIFVGDHTSPFSSAYQLVAASTGMKLKPQFRVMLPTTLGALAVSAVFFLLMDMNGSWHTQHTAALQPQFKDSFHYSAWFILPVLVLLGAMLLRQKTKVSFLLSVSSAIVLGCVTQHIGIGQWMDYLWSGYHSPAFASLHTKGLSNMVELILLIALAGAFNGILEENRILQPHIKKLLGTNSVSLFPATLRTVLFALCLSLVACTQTLPIMMTGRSLLPFWEERFPRSQLARVVADSSLILPGLVPWNMLAILCGTISGVSVERYVPYAPFLWALPLCTLVWSLRWKKPSSLAKPQDAHHSAPFLNQ
ncbi:Na+/H+ antiporter NhaC family protein [Gorillibacterium massiliense]|uniref:Na+/H+ antiporter NhaC family protein n=1 Tax=Gorillibacterium massiliense TaxID=1280390 RepID=UPI0005931937|nr:Na+/H+ antiporter NhaC family protein [Gorillibacterium massiliense]